MPNAVSSDMLKPLKLDHDVLSIVQLLKDGLGMTHSIDLVDFQVEIEMSYLKLHDQKRKEPVSAYSMSREPRSIVGSDFGIGSDDSVTGEGGFDSNAGGGGSDEDGGQAGGRSVHMTVAVVGSTETVAGVAQVGGGGAAAAGKRKLGGHDDGGVTKKPKLTVAGGGGSGVTQAGGGGDAQAGGSGDATAGKRKLEGQDDGSVTVTPSTRPMTDDR